MHIWSIRLLTTDLKFGRVSSKQAFCYLLVGSVINVLDYGGGTLLSRSTATSTNVFTIVVGLVFLVGGLLFLFYTFPKGHEHQFLNWYIPLLVPLSLRLILGYLALYVIYIVVALVGSSFYAQHALLLFWIYEGVAYVMYGSLFAAMYLLFRRIAGN